jgi:hypothetical protein
LHALIDCHDHSPNSGLDEKFYPALEPRQIVCRRGKLPTPPPSHTALRRAVRCRVSSRVRPR